MADENVRLIKPREPVFQPNEQSQERQQSQQGEKTPEPEVAVADSPNSPPPPSPPKTPTRDEREFPMNIDAKGNATDYCRVSILTYEREGLPPVFFIRERADSEHPMTRELTDYIARPLYFEHQEQIGHPSQIVWYEEHKERPNEPAHMEQVHFVEPNRNLFPEAKEWREGWRNSAEPPELGKAIRGEPYSPSETKPPTRSSIQSQNMDLSEAQLPNIPGHKPEP